MEDFVIKTSVVRRIWGKSDTILFIFAGAAAEFALNKAVDWLYFTGRLPSDPLARLFSTVAYSRAIVFSEKQAALRAIKSIADIHKKVESQRGEQIPEWAYRDVLFLLIDYSIRSFEVLERKLNNDEKHEVFDVFYRIGFHMGIKGLPQSFAEYEQMRLTHLHQNLYHNYFTDDLFAQYRKHLGAIRYSILLKVQTLIVPEKVRHLLGLGSPSYLHLLIWMYKVSRSLKLDWIMRELLLPADYKKQIKALDKESG